MGNALPIIQIILSIILIVSVLLQQSEAGLGAAFGGSGDAGFQHTRRGFEKVLFYTSLIVGILFVLTAILALFL